MRPFFSGYNFTDNRADYSSRISPRATAFFAFPGGAKAQRKGTQIPEVTSGNPRSARFFALDRALKPTCAGPHCRPAAPWRKKQRGPWHWPRPIVTRNCFGARSARAGGPFRRRSVVAKLAADGGVAQIAAVPAGQEPLWGGQRRLRFGRRQRRHRFGRLEELAENLPRPLRAGLEAMQVKHDG